MSRALSGSFERLVRSDTARYRWSLCSRVLCAVVGGYALTTLLTLSLPLLLERFGIQRAQTLFATSMASFWLYAGVILTVFHARSVRRAWLVIALACLPLLLVFAICRWLGAPP